MLQTLQRMITSIPHTVRSLSSNAEHTVCSLSSNAEIIDKYGKHGATAAVNLACLYGSYTCSYALTNSRFVGLTTAACVTLSLLVQTALTCRKAPDQQQTALPSLNNPSNSKENYIFQKITPALPYGILAAIYSLSYIFGSAEKTPLFSVSFIVVGSAISAIVGRQHRAFSQNFSSMIQDAIFRNNVTPVIREWSASIMESYAFRKTSSVISKISTIPSSVISKISSIIQRTAKQQEKQKTE